MPIPRLPAVLLLVVALPWAPPLTASTLEPIRVEATRLQRSWDELPAALSEVNLTQAQLGQPGVQLDEVLFAVPGLQVSNRYNFAQNLRLSSRGFGARAPFGVRGLQVRLDGFPETLPDGQSQLDNIDLDNLQRIQVLRGPASVLYGNASGAVLDMHSYSGANLPEPARLSLVGGADGLQRLHARAASGDTQRHQLIAVNGLNYHGYRDHSQVQSVQLSGRTGGSPAPGHQLDLFARLLHTNKAQDPGGLTRSQLRENRRQASAFAKPLDAGQQVAQQRLALSHRYQHQQGLWQGRLFISHRDFQQQLPFPGNSRIDFTRLFYGAGADYQSTLPLFNREHRYLIGFDLGRQEDDRQRRRVNGQGQIVGLSAEELQSATASGAFVQLSTPLRPGLTLASGLRLDQLRLAIDDRFLDDGDDSGQRRFTELSYSAGLNWQAHPHHLLYLSASTAFESPTFTEFANPQGGGFNPQLQPQQAFNREIGARGQLNERLLYDLALFHIEVDDEIQPFQLEGRTFYRNSGETRRQGSELALEHLTTEQISLQLAWTWADYRFRKGNNNGEPLDGQRLPGQPRHQLHSRLLWQRPNGTFVQLQSTLQSAQYAEDGNHTRVPSQHFVALRGGQTLSGTRQILTLFAGIDNLFNRQGLSNIRINANSDRPLSERGYFEPAPERHLYLGMQLAWR